MFNFFKKSKEKLPMLVKTDIHCHVIPGVDDGSPDLATSVELVKRMTDLGFERIIASPHVTAETFENTSAILDPALSTLNSALEAEPAGSVVRPIERSAEYRMDWFFKQLLEADGTPDVKTLPHNFILVENSFYTEPVGLDGFLYDLRMRGYIPVLAHPERYAYYREQRKRYDELHRSGVLFQINLLSLAGYYGKSEQRMAEELLNRGYIDFIGSDIHRHRHIDCLEHYLTTSHYRKLTESLRPQNDNL